MGKPSINIFYFVLALLFILGAWIWKMWPLVVLAVPAIVAIFIKRRTR